MARFAVLTTACAVLLFSTSHAQYLPGLVNQVPELSSFFALLNNTPELYQRVKQGGVTLLAPTNDALSSSASSTANASTAQIDALLRYHILEGQIAGAALYGHGPTTFFPTLLDNPTYSNITGGQVVGAKGVAGNTKLLSGLWSECNLVQSDIFYERGLIHSIDAVLEIPTGEAQSLTGANLSDYIALGETTQIVQPQNIGRVSGIQIWPDVTVFAPNNPNYSSNYKGWLNLTLEQQYDIWYYHLINGSVLYSSNLTNGSTFKTSLGYDITSWVADDGSIYINDAKLTHSDLLIANGVVQVLDKPLNYNDTHAKPASLAGSSTGHGQGAHTTHHAQQKSKGGGLSTGAQAGIGVGVAIAGLALVGGLVYFLFARRRKDRGARVPDEKNETGSDGAPPIPIATKPKTANEMATKSNTWELEQRNRDQELSPGSPVSHEVSGERRPQELP